MNEQELIRLDGTTYEVPGGRAEVTFLTIPHFAERDAPFLLMWLRSKRSPHTRSAYVCDIEHFYLFTQKSLAEITLTDMQNFADSLLSQELATQARTLAAVKSCFMFCHKAGYLPANPCLVVKLPKPKDELASRILSERVVGDLLFVTRSRPRDHVLLSLLYHAALRAEEITSLTWRDCTVRGDAGQITVYGKGSKTRQVLLSPSTWAELQSLRPAGSVSPDSYVFESRKTTRRGLKQIPSRKLSTTRIYGIVEQAAREAGIQGKVSPHWLRHSHATHALENGAPISLVKETLGHSSIETTGRYLHARPNTSSAQYLKI